MLTGTNLTYTKAYNYRIVFETIRLYGPLSRADIARRTSLTAQTVSNIVKRLLDTQLIMEGTKRQEGRGAPSVTLDINPSGAYSIGLDFNRDHLTGVLVDLTGKMKQRVFYELNAPSPKEGVELMASTIRELMDFQGIGEDQLDGVGIGFPGPMVIHRDNSVSNVVNPKAFPNWENVPVIHLLSKYIDVPIFMGNNASAATIGERWYGAGRHISTFMYIFFGAGLGSGVFLNGQLYEGFTGNSGEIGYIPYQGKPSPISDEGQLHIGEHFNLSKLYRWLSDKGFNVSRPTELAPLLSERNKFFIQWLDQAVELLVPAFLSVEYLIDPEVIFFGGRLPKPITAYIMDGLREEIPKQRILGLTKGPDLQLATAGVDAAALGAATLPMFELFAPEHQVLIKQEANGS